MNTKTAPPPVASGSTASTRLRSRRRRHGTFEIAGGAVIAIGVAILVRAFGVSSAFVLAGVAYIAFVATVACVELGAARRDVEIDLTVEPDAVAPDPEAAQASFLRSVPDTLDQPIRRRRINPPDVVEACIAALAAAAFAELLRIVLRMSSTVGFVAWWYVAFIAIYFLLARDRSDAEAALDRVMTMCMWSVALLVVAVLVWMVGYVAAKGFEALSWHFFIEDLSRTGPLTPGGGGSHAIIGTLEQVALATVVVVPVGILTAVYLHEVHGRIARPVRFIVDAMSGLPSIIAGLLIFTVWVGAKGYSGVAGAAALAVLMLPTMTRASEEMLRTVPDALREGALALGSPQWRVVQRVVLPTALTGLVTAALLSIARAIGETAPVLITALGSDTYNKNPTKGAQADLPLMIWKLIREPNKTQQARAWTAAFVLITIVFVLFVTARIVANHGRKRLEGSR